MSAGVLIDARIYWGGADMSGQSNKVTADAKLNPLDSTTFASGIWEECAGGLFSGTSTVDGFWAAGDAGKPDDRLFADLGVATVPQSLVPTAAGAAHPSVGGLAYLGRAQETKYSLFGPVGELTPFSVDTRYNTPVLRGQVLHPNGTARTTTGTGTGVQLGAVTALQRMFAALHVHSVAGTSSPTITVKLQSSVDNTFASPTDRVTFTGATAISGQFSSAIGAITDTWWRAAWTISGSSPSFTFTVTAGIGPSA